MAYFFLPMSGPRKNEKANSPALTAQAKCMLGDETRLIPLNSHCSVVELMNNVRVKFPGIGPFVLKYLDRCASMES